MELVGVSVLVRMCPHHTGCFLVLGKKEEK